MIRKFFLAVLGLMFLVFSVSSTNLFTCEFKTGNCGVNETAFFYASPDFFPDDGGPEPDKVMSSHVRLSYNDDYNKALCCKLNDPMGQSLGLVNFNHIPVGDSCATGAKDLVYYTGDTNARLAFRSSLLFNQPFYSHKTCVEIPDDFSGIDIFVSDEDKSYLGYSCIFKVSGLENGVVSSCDGTFNGGDQYNHTVWARLWEDVSSLKCDSDCTSRLDGRVYTACAGQINICSDMPLVCNGALLGSWVWNGSTEIQCSSPWTNTRDVVFTQEDLKVESSASDCSNIIVREYPVLLDNELVNMKVYICADEK